MRTVGFMAQVAIVACVSGAALAQGQFAGKWQTKISPTTGKHSITVNIVVKEGKIVGTVVVVNPPDGSEIEWPIVNSGISGGTLRFETSLKNDKFIWRLTLKKGGRQGFLHGSTGHMLIDEPVVRSPRS